MTPNFWAPACTHPSPVAALALRPSGACQRERFPLQVPRGRRWPRQRGSTLPSQDKPDGSSGGGRGGGLADDGGRAAIAAQFPSHERVNQTDDAQELEALRRSVQRGRPFGQPEWQKEIAKRLGLESAYRPTGSPAKGGPKSKYLARVKISQTSAGPPRLTISDLSRFPRSCPAFPPRRLLVPLSPPVPLSPLALTP